MLQILVSILTAIRRMKTLLVVKWLLLEEEEGTLFPGLPHEIRKTWVPSVIVKQPQV